MIYKILPVNKESMISIYVCMYVYIYVCVCVCVYIYIYVLTFSTMSQELLEKLCQMTAKILILGFH